MIRNTQLTLLHVGLGSLGEYALMILFADALLQRLSAGKQTRIDDIVDRDGKRLYPAFYTTHLRVPPTHLLRGYRLWDEVSIGVEVRSFGGLQLDSVYALGRPGDIPDDPAAWDLRPLPSMRGGNLFVIDHRDHEQQVSVPKAGLVAELPKLSEPPAAMDRFRQVRVQAAGFFGLDGQLQSRQPISYPVVAGRDVAVEPDRPYAGHSMAFAKFIEIMDFAERVMLTEHTWPPFPSELLNCATILEREIYYFGTCQENQTVSVELSGELGRCPPHLHGSSSEIVSAGILRVVMNLYEAGSKKLLAVTQLVKLLAVPSAQQGLLRDAERLLFVHGVEATTGFSEGSQPWQT